MRLKITALFLLCVSCAGMPMASLAQTPAPSSATAPVPALAPAEQQRETPAAEKPDAIQPPAPLNASTDQLDAVQRKLEKLSADVEKASTDDNRLAEIKVDVDAASKQISDITATATPRLDQIKARLTELGEAPGEGAPPEAAVVTQERARLIAERGEINALTGTAETLSTQASKLSGSITETRRQLFGNTLLKRTEIDGAVLTEAASTIVGEGSALFQRVSSWLTFAWSFKRVPLLTALSLSLGAALVLLSGSRRLFSPLIKRSARHVEPSYITRLSVAFWSTMIPTTVMMMFSSSTYFFLQTFTVLRPDIAPLVSGFLGVSTALLFVSSLAIAVLSPLQSTWRLVRVSDRAALQLVIAIIAMMTINGLDYLAGIVSEALGSPILLTVVKSLIASVLVGLILIAMAFIRPIVPPAKTLDEPGKRWPRPVLFLFLAAGALLIVAALSGYVGLARFIAGQIVFTSAILVAMYIGILTGKALAKQNALAATVMGRYLARRYRFDPVALDQAGLVTGLGIYALVVMFFIPLVFLQWGFQIADIQAFAYRFVTEIKIGSITISLVGIFAGIILFVIGYIITRWFQRWLDGSVMARSRVDLGVRNSVKTGIGYLGLGTAGLIGISAAGLNLSSLALVAGALSLGVGFGLQNIVSNFVSGLILLVERPFKVGDWVVTGTNEGFVKRISVRATEIETFQRQTILVPNSLFINASVGNWTHRNKLGRSDIAVVVGYDSVPRRVMELLLEIAEQHPMVLKNPQPLAVFTAFGEATMTFELRIYLADITNGAGVRNDLRLTIYERFAEEKIGAPFGKADLEDEPPVIISDEGDETEEESLRPQPEETPAEAVERRSGTARRPRRVSVADNSGSK